MEGILRESLRKEKVLSEGRKKRVTALRTRLNDIQHKFIGYQQENNALKLNLQQKNKEINILNQQLLKYRKHNNTKIKSNGNGLFAAKTSTSTASMICANCVSSIGLINLSCQKHVVCNNCFMRSGSLQCTACIHRQ